MWDTKVGYQSGIGELRGYHVNTNVGEPLNAVICPERFDSDPVV